MEQKQKYKKVMPKIIMAFVGIITTLLLVVVILSNNSKQGFSFKNLKTDIVGGATGFSASVCDHEDILHISKEECLSLKQFYDLTVNDSPWMKNESGWGTLGDVGETWYGITGKGGNINQIYLPNIGLSGDIGTWSLPNSVHFFYINGNNLSGDISGWKLVKNYDEPTIRRVDISDNNFSGDLSGWRFYGSKSFGNLMTLNLQNNNLSGDISNWNTNPLLHIVGFEVGNNHFTGEIPMFISSFVEGSRWISLESNNFTFTDIEPRIEEIRRSNAKGLKISPQAKVDSNKTIDVNAGGTLTITPELPLNPSGHDSYEWFKDGVSLGASSVDNRVFTKTVTATDSGRYTYKVTNSVVPELILLSKDIIVNVAVGAVCDLSHLNFCNTQTACTGVSGNWCNNQCQSDSCAFVCDFSHLNLCNTQAVCTGASGNWCNNQCQSDSCAFVCDLSHLNLCNTQAVCTGASGNWCNNQCQSSSCAGGVVIRADVNQDGNVTATDALLTLKKAVDYNLTKLEGMGWHTSVTTGDVNCDGEVKATDAMLILKKAVGGRSQVELETMGWCSVE